MSERWHLSPAPSVLDARNRDDQSCAHGGCNACSQHSGRRLRSAGWVVLRNARAGTRGARPVTSDGVRAVGTSIADLLTAGRDRSPTFRSLLRDIDASGWIVFVQSGSCQVAQLSSCLLHRVGVFEGQHYLRLIVGNQALSDDAIATIGHELQHAVEVTSALGITEGPQIRQLYRRIGYVSVRAPGAEVYETTAAINARATVLRELRSTRPR